MYFNFGPYHGIWSATLLNYLASKFILTRWLTHVIIDYTRHDSEYKKQNMDCVLDHALIHTGGGSGRGRGSIIISFGQCNAKLVSCQKTHFPGAITVTTNVISLY